MHASLAGLSREEYGQYIRVRRRLEASVGRLPYPEEWDKIVHSTCPMALHTSNPKCLEFLIWRAGEFYDPIIVSSTDPDSHRLREKFEKQFSDATIFCSAQAICEQSNFAPPEQKYFCFGWWRFEESKKRIISASKRLWLGVGHSPDMGQGDAAFQL